MAGNEPREKDNLDQERDKDQKVETHEIETDELDDVSGAGDKNCGCGISADVV